MTDIQKIVLNNLLGRIDKDFYDELEDFVGNKIEDFDELSLSKVIEFLTIEINNLNDESNYLIDQTLYYSQFLSPNQINYNLMVIEINLFRAREEEKYLDSQLSILNGSNKKMSLKNNKKNL